MVVVIVLLAVLAVGGAVLALLTHRRLADQRRLVMDAEARAVTRETELARRAAELQSATAERDAAITLATQRAAEAQAAGESAAAAAAEAQAARDRAAAAEAAHEPDGAGLDPDVLWILEQVRTERTWRFSVAPHPQSPSVFAGQSNRLLAALQVELDAAREDVGAVVELDAELPEQLTSAASVLALRAVQELVADVVRRSEESTVHLRTDGRDLLVDIEAVDEDGAPVTPTPLPLPPSSTLEVTPTGVRIRDATGR